MTGALLTVVLAAAPRLWAPGPVGQSTRERVRVFVEIDQTTTFTLEDAGLRCSTGPRFKLSGAPVSTPDAGEALDGGVDGGVDAPTPDVAEQPTPAVASEPARVGPVDGGAWLAHCSVSLSPGANTFTAAVGPADGGARVTAVLTRYLTTGTIPVELDRAGFGPGTVHRPEIEALCAQCHRMERPDGGSDGAFCSSCHAEIMQRPIMHGPVQQGACLPCHDPASAPSRYQVRWPIQETCFSCHVDIKALMERKAVRHGPAAAGRCTTCHDPHGTDQQYWLKLRPYDLCTNCHTEKRGERHVVVGFVYGDSHPLQGRPHPFKERTEFGCPSCHNPHAAQARFLWQFDVTTRDSLCRTCHQK
ncbi:MAG: hypothetical protein JNJ54_29635 [Myxococcaceae bacterium]|nr:hypothetical protein [Myxococcaceae bacterium]